MSNSIETSFVNDDRGRYDTNEVAMMEAAGIRVEPASSIDRFPPEPPEGTVTTAKAWDTACAIARACNGKAPSEPQVKAIMTRHGMTAEFEETSALTRALIATKQFVPEVQDSISAAVSTIVMLRK